MANKGEVKARVGLDTRPLEKALGNIERRLNKTARKLEGYGRSLTNNVTAPILALGGASLVSFAKIQRLEKGLEAIEGSAELARKRLNELNAIAQAPGISLEQAVKAELRLRSVGFAAEDTNEILRQTANANALVGGTTDSLDGVSLAILQIGSSAKLTQEDLNQLTERLPQVRAILDEAYGSSRAEDIREVAGSTREVIDVITRGLAQLPRATGGIGNAFENLQNSATLALSRVGESIDKALDVTGLLNSLADTINSLADSFTKLSPQAQKTILVIAGLTAAVGPFLLLLSRIPVVLGLLTQGFNQLVRGFKLVQSAFLFFYANPVILGVTLAVAALAAIGIYLADNWEVVKNRVTRSFTIISNNIRESVNNILDSLNPILDFLGFDELEKLQLSAVPELEGQFKTLGQTVDSVKAKVGAFFGAAGGGSSAGAGGTPPGAGGSPAGPGPRIEKLDLSNIEFDDSDIPDLEIPDEKLKIGDPFAGTRLADSFIDYQIQLEKAERLTRALNVTQTASQTQFDVLAAKVSLSAQEVQRLNSVNQLTTEQGQLTLELYQEQVLALEALNQKKREQAEEDEKALERQAQLSQVIQAVGSTAEQAFQQVAKGEKKIGEAIKATGKQIIVTILDVIQANVIKGITGAISSALQLPFPANLIAGGLAAGAATALFGFVKGKIAGFAQGGIVQAGSPVMGLIGEAGRDEAVIPLGTAMADKYLGGGGGFAQGEFIVRGEDLILVMERVQEGRPRTR